MATDQQPEDIRQAYRIAYLLAGYVKGTLSEDELRELHAWKDRSHDNKAVFEELTQKHSLEKGLAARIADDSNVESYLAQSKSQPAFKAARRKYRLVTIALAAAALLILFLLVYRPDAGNSPPPDSDLAKDDLSPGGHSATLKVASGELIPLSNRSTDTSIGTARVNASNAELSYLSSADAPVQFHELSVPAKGFYKLVLPDGTKVWLNSSSSLRYPSRFTGNERMVTLTGEGYFDVAHNDQQPFRVSANGVLIEDIGTAFNVNAYPDEKGVVTTMVEGVARVGANDQSKVINANQQASVINGSINVKVVETDLYDAWVKNLFHFDDTPLEDIMRQLARWYDAKIIYENAPKNVPLTAEISRQTSVSKVLYLLAKTGEVHFRVEGDNIIVTR